MSNRRTDLLDRAIDLHHRAIVVDTHCDTTQKLMDRAWRFDERHEHGHVDLPRLREGGVCAVFLAAWSPASGDAQTDIEAARAQLIRMRELTTEHTDALVFARCAEDIRSAKQSDRIAIVPVAEGGHLIGESLDALRRFHELGAAYLTLTHAEHTSWADSAGVHQPFEPRHDGLTSFGREVVRELNRLGMMVDVSHVSDKTFWDVMDTSGAPVIASHSSCRAVSPHRRNLSDEMIKAIASSGGVVQINFASLFIDPHHPPVDIAELKRRIREGTNLTNKVTDYETPLSCLADHFVHAIRLVGPQHVGIGSDFDGVPAVPREMTDCSMLPNLTAELLARGFSEIELQPVLGENVLRVMEACARLAAGNHVDVAPTAACPSPTG